MLEYYNVMYLWVLLIQMKIEKCKLCRLANRHSILSKLDGYW